MRSGKPRLCFCGVEVSLPMKITHALRPMKSMYNYDFPIRLLELANAAHCILPEALQYVKVSVLPLCDEAQCMGAHNYCVRLYSYSMQLCAI